MPNKINSTRSNELLLEPADKKNIDANEIEPKVIRPEDMSDAATNALPKEINGPKGLEPTRYGDWESKGRCYDF